MSDPQPILHVRVLQDTPRGGARHLVLRFDQPLLVEGKQRFLVPGSDALDNPNEYTPLMRNIVVALFTPSDIGMIQMVVTPEHLTIDHYAALSNSRIFGTIWRAASRAGLAYSTSVPSS